MTTATKDIATKLEEWAGEIAGLNAFPEDPQDIDQAFPIVVCEIQRRRKVAASPALSQYQHEQRDLRVWTARLVIMVAPTRDGQDAFSLYDMTDELEAALLRDKTLGGRVEAAASEVDVEFPGELQHPSGTVALGAYFQVTVGESAEV
jgi:hypothetical protein